MLHFNLIVPCTSKKSISSSPYLEFRNYNDINIQDAYYNYKEALTLNMPSKPARDMYNLNIIKDITDYYILSTAYGLIKDTEFVKPYSITFSDQSLDYVGARYTNRLWAEELIKDNRFNISNIIDNGKKTILVISKLYFEAFRKEILACDPDSFLIISPDTKPSKDIEHYFIPCQQRITKKLGGNKFTFALKTAEYIIKNLFNLSKPEIITHMQGILNEIPYKKKTFIYKERLNDAELIQYIKDSGKDINNRSQIRGHLHKNNIGCGEKRLTNILLSIK